MPQQQPPPPAQWVLLPADQLRQMLADAVTQAVTKAAEVAPPPAPADHPDYLTKKEAADLLRVTPHTIDAYARDGNLSKLKIGVNRTRFRRAEVVALLREV